MDHAFNKIGDAVMGPVIGPQLNELASLNGRSNNANSQGSSYGSGWYGYIDKDLRTLLGDQVTDKFQTQVLRAGQPHDLPQCTVAGTEVCRRRAAGCDRFTGPAATGARTRTRSGSRSRRRSSVSMRWTNRPTYQQVISYDSHR